MITVEGRRVAELADPAEPVLTALAIEAETPIGGDIRNAAFSQACIDEAAENPVFHALLADYGAARPQSSASQLVNLLERVYLKQLLRQGDAENFLQNARSPSNWRPFIKEVSSPTTPTGQEIANDLATRNPTSNVVDRYKSIELVVQLSLGRLPRHPSILDVGCSQNHGLKKLALLPTFKHSLPFKLTAMDIHNSAKTNGFATEVANTLLLYAGAVGPSLGVDIVDAQSLDAREWAEACSFYPRERLNNERVEEYGLLDNAQPEQVSFRQLDFSSPDAPAEISSATDIPNRHFDLVVFLTVKNQASQRRRQAMMDNALAMVSPDGYIVEQDFLRLPVKDHKPRYYRNWEPPFRYRTIIYDPRKPSEPYEILRWRNARCQEVQFMHDIGRLPLAASYGLAKR